MSIHQNPIASDVRIDWLSFTRKIKPSLTPREALNKVKDDLISIPRVASLIQGDIADWENAAPRYPYKLRVSDKSGGINIFVGDSADHYLVEISGRSCEGWGQESERDGGGR